MTLSTSAETIFPNARRCSRPGHIDDIAFIAKVADSDINSWRWLLVNVENVPSGGAGSG